MNYVSTEIRNSTSSFKTKNLSCKRLYLYMMERLVTDRNNDLDELEDIRRYRWYYCRCTERYWRFDYKEKVFDAVLQVDHVEHYVKRRKKEAEEQHIKKTHQEIKCLISTMKDSNRERNNYYD